MFLTDIEEMTATHLDGATGSTQRTNTPPITALTGAPCLQLQAVESVHTHRATVLGRLHRGVTSLPEYSPGNVWPDLFAAHHVAASARLTLNGWAVLSRHPVFQPGMNGLMPVVFDVQYPSCICRTAEDGDSSRCRSPSWGGTGDFHAPQCTQVFLACKENLSYQGKTPHERLAGMSIHKKIKALRERQGLSHEGLAKAVREIDGKPLTRVAVQQWEKEGGTAPKRTRVWAVAKALGVSVNELVEATHPSGQDPSPRSFTDLQPLEAALVMGFRPLDEGVKTSLLSLVNAPARLAQLLALLGDAGNDWEFVTFARELQELTSEGRSEWIGRIRDWQKDDPLPGTSATHRAGSGRGKKPGRATGTEGAE